MEITKWNGKKLLTCVSICKVRGLYKLFMKVLNNSWCKIFHLSVTLHKKSNFLMLKWHLDLNNFSESDIIYKTYYYQYDHIVSFTIHSCWTPRHIFKSYLCHLKKESPYLNHHSRWGLDMYNRNNITEVLHVTL